MRPFDIAGLALLIAAVPAGSAPAAPAPAPAPAAVWADPAPDAAHPAALVKAQIASHGAMMNAVVLTPSGAGPHPALLLLHGFPGNEQNLDFAQAARRQGWVVLTLHYRGSWGSGGDFSFGNVIEDTAAAYDWLAAPEQVAKFGIDLARIIIAGHSMGGFAAVLTAAARPKIAGTLLMDAWNPGLGTKATAATVGQAGIAASLTRNTAPLSGTSGEALAAELLANKDKFDLTAYAPALAGRPVFTVAATRGLFEENRALTASLKAAGAGKLVALEWPTDHSFSDHRIALISASLDWLHQFETKP